MSKTYTTEEENMAPPPAPPRSLDPAPTSLLAVLRRLAGSSQKARSKTMPVRWQVHLYVSDASSGTWKTCTYVSPSRHALWSCTCILYTGTMHKSLVLGYVLAPEDADAPIEGSSGACAKRIRAQCKHEPSVVGGMGAGEEGWGRGGRVMVTEAFREGEGRRGRRQQQQFPRDYYSYYRL